MTTTLPPAPPMNGEGSGNPSSAVSPATTRPSAADPSVHVLTHHEEAGVRKTLNARHLQMIALGSAIGTGLLLGSGSRLQQAGPSLAILYLVCGFFGYIILRNLGELVAYRPSSGSFVSYAREFYGEKMAYVAGWLYWGQLGHGRHRRLHRCSYLPEVVRPVQHLYRCASTMGAGA